MDIQAFKLTKTDTRFGEAEPLEVCKKIGKLKISFAQQHLDGSDLMVKDLIRYACIRSEQGF